MRYLLTFILLLVGTQVVAQDWVTDKEFDGAISGKNAFEEDYDIVIIEFYADFNKDNAFKDWEKLEGVKYYRCNIADSPDSKKKHRS